jgi:ABC-type transport system involved in multi-copper enzyme maturation permease subunit
VAPIVRKELRDAIGNRWLIGYAALLGVLGLAATASGLDGAAGLALQGFGRATATLMNLCLLLAPLVAVLMGAAAIAGEQERGTLEHLLAQPLSRSQLLLGKHAGLLIALIAATVAGFVPAGMVIAYQAGLGVLAHYAIFPALASLAAAAMIGVGLVISVSSRSAVQAQGAAVFAWFACALLYDLLLIGTLAVSGVPAPWLAGTLLANPIDAARVLGVLALEPDLYLLGPAGAWLSTQLSPSGAALVLLAALLAWALLPAAAGLFIFSKSLRRKRSHDSKEFRVMAGRERARRGDRVHVGRGIAGG